MGRIWEWREGKKGGRWGWEGREGDCPICVFFDPNCRFIMQLLLLFDLLALILLLLLLLLSAAVGA